MTHPIPILTYHQIDAAPARGAPFRSLYVSPKAFARQMALLAGLGYRGLSMAALLPYLKGEKTGKVVGITFDDGYLNNLVHAAPVLQRHGFGATCYFVSQRLGGTNDWDAALGVAQTPLMNASQLREWAAAGQDVGAHSRNHVRLGALPAATAREEIAASKTELAVSAALLLGGRLALRPALRWIARSRTPEIVTAASLLLVVATAALMHAVGLSMALGAFLAGVLLAESEYRRELETDLEPFKGLLLGLFFIAVGMSIDFAVVWARPGWVALIVLGFVAVKALVLVAMARAMKLPLAERPLFVILLAQGGEFGFVVFQAAAQAGVIDATTSSLMVAAVAISMLLTPLALVIVDRWVTPRLSPRGAPLMAEINEPQRQAVIIAGFGRYGQIVGRLLLANGITPTVLDHDSEQIEGVRRFGWRAFYGDATRLDLLRVAGAAQARVLVVAIDDVEQSLALVDLAREHFPQLTLVARARNVQHWYQLNERGVTQIERETFDSALMSGRSTLEALGFQRHQARNLALRFRRHNLEQLKESAPHFRDESKLIAMSKIGRQQMEQFMADERTRKDSRVRTTGWAEPARDQSKE